MPLSLEDLAALSRLLDEALDLSASQHEAWLRALPREDVHLASALREMLSVHGRTAGLLAGLPELDSNQHDDSAVAHAGERVGPYRLIREIGRGGMGAVWLAERADGAYKRTVALKLPRLTWAAGLAKRMARERDIGAMLEHPNIARLYDAGVDEKGRPYIALEHIDGMPIDAWCRQQNLSVRDRLKLIVQAAKALSYAHGRLVVHRDLKPSNILVGADGQVRLLDFGIAQLLQRDDEGEPITQELSRVLTPSYAAPEQLEGKPVTVASDIYSLGVLGYELLVGALPHQPKRKTLGALEEAILQGDAALASARASDKAVARQLRGDLDAIVAKALNADPAQRYATADAMAEDIERHLHGERVLAQPDSTWYRLRVAVRRHRLGLLTTSAVVLSIVVGSAMAIAQARRAAAAAERQHLVTEFVSEVFRLSSGTDTPTRRLRLPSGERFLLEGAELIERRFETQPELQAQLFGAVGRSFLEMGDYAQASDYAWRQVEKLRLAGADAAAQAEALITLSKSLSRDGYWDVGDDLDADAQAEEAARDAVQKAAPFPPSSANALAWYARVLVARGKVREAGPVLELLQSTTTALGRPSLAEAWLYGIRGKMLINQYEESNRLRKQAIEIAVRVEGGDSTTAAQLRLGMALNCLSHGQVAEAKELTDAAFDTYRQAGGLWALRGAIGKARWAPEFYLWKNTTYQEAEQIVSAARIFLQLQAVAPKVLSGQVEYSQGLLGLYSGDVEGAWTRMKSGGDVLLQDRLPSFTRFNLVNRLADAAMLSGHHAEAEDLLHEQGRIRVQQGEGRNPLAVFDILGLALNQGQAGRFGEATATLATVPKWDALSIPGETAAMLENIAAWIHARVLTDQGDTDAAWQLVGELQPSDVPDVEYGFSQRILHAELQCARGDPTAGARLESIADDLSKDRHAFAVMPAWARSKAGLCAAKRGDAQTARRLAQAASRAVAGQPGMADYYKRPLRELEAWLVAHLQ